MKILWKLVNNPSTLFILTTMSDQSYQFFFPVLTVLLLLLISGLGGFAYRYPNQTKSHVPITQPKADFTAAIWTYHFGYDNQGWPSLDRAAELLNNTGESLI